MLRSDIGTHPVDDVLTSTEHDLSDVDQNLVTALDVLATKANVAKALELVLEHVLDAIQTTTACLNEGAEAGLHFVFQPDTGT